MRIYNHFIVNQFDTLSDGNSGANLPVAVRLPSTGEKATLYDEEGQEIDNPVFTGPAGNYSFYIDEGFYNIIENEGAASAFTKFNEPILGGAGASIEEEITLDDTQIDVVFEQINTFTALFFIQGQNVDRGLLNEGADQDYTVINSSTIRLTSSRPAGSSVKAYGGIEAPDGEVISVFGRTGPVIAKDDDYTASQITSVPSGEVTADNVQGAIDELDGRVKSNTDSIAANAGDILTNANDINQNALNIKEVKLNNAIYNNQTGVTYTLTARDRGKTVTMDNAAANTVTIDANANEAMPLNSVVLIRQLGVGVTSLTASAGVELNGIDGGTVEFTAQFETSSIDQYSIDKWIYTGAGEVS